jgi:hypothetical protein
MLKKQTPTSFQSLTGTEAGRGGGKTDGKFIRIYLKNKIKSKKN